MAWKLEEGIPGVQYNGLNTDKAVTFGSTLAVTGAITANGGVAGTVTGAVVGTTVAASGAVSAKNATAAPATAGAVAAGAPIVLNSNAITIECTTDVPTHSRPIGSICINLGGNSGSTRMYVATSAAGAWTAFTTAG